MAYRAVQHNGNNLFGFSILTVSSSSSSFFVVAAAAADASRFQWPFVDWLRIPRISNCPVGLCVCAYIRATHHSPYAAGIVVNVCPRNETATQNSQNRKEFRCAHVATVCSRVSVWVSSISYFICRGDISWVCLCVCVSLFFSVLIAPYRREMEK